MNKSDMQSQAYGERELKKKLNLALCYCNDQQIPICVAKAVVLKSIDRYLIYYLLWKLKKCGMGVSMILQSKILADHNLVGNNCCHKNPNH